MSRIVIAAPVTAARFYLMSAIGVLLSAASGCDQAAVPTETRPPVASIGAAGPIPTRAEEAAAAGMHHWSLETDSSLWVAGATTDTMFSIGLKAPGAIRGMWQGKRLVSTMAVLQAREAIGRISGIRVVWVDSVLPKVRVKIADPQRLGLLRALPFVDYVVPSLTQVALASENSGCDVKDYTGPRTYAGAYYDVISPVLTRHFVEQAWRYSTGANVMLGMTDTGVESENDWEFANPLFGSGASTGRQHYFGVSRHGYPPIPPIGISCDHGTNLAGIMSAPLNGMGVVGIAYRAYLIDIDQAESVWPDYVDAENAIPMAVAPQLLSSGGSSKVINLAWGLNTWHDGIADQIKYYSAPPYDVLFVGAAGTGHPLTRNVLFPASMAEVLAVSASADDGDRPSSAHHGPKVQLTAFVDGPTAGAYRRYPYDSLDKVGGSSAATAVVSGIATLVRSRYPTMSASAVRQRLVSTAGPSCGMIPAWAPLVNALAAVGGICYDGWITGPVSVNTYYNFTTLTPVTFSATASGGAGALEYRWSNGEFGPQATYWMRRGNYDSTITVTISDLATGAYVNSRFRAISVHSVPYTASINGPDEVKPYESCLWSASSTHSSEALTYQWSVNGSPVGDDSPYLRWSGGGSGYTLSVSITNAAGEPAYTSREVTVSYSAASCLDS